MYQKCFSIVFLFIIICFMGLVFSLYSIDGFQIDNIVAEEQELNFIDNKFLWPTANYKTITSPFGNRKAPTGGAGTFHAGIDIGAPCGSEIRASFSGTVTYVGFWGANGYTIKISDGIYLANYSHVSPYFLVYEGQFVNKGDIIGTVGPKNVYDVPNNKYKDSNRKSYKWCNNRTSSSFFFIY